VSDHRGPGPAGRGPEPGEAHDALAGLFVYPDDGFPARLVGARQALTRTDAAAAAELDRFAADIERQSIEAMQELFTRTFDINPECALEVGWHLFGEEYLRGAFLVRMREELRRLGMEESAELPDHLTHVLAILARWSGERADDFATACVLPAVDRMLQALAGKDDPYESALRAVRVFLAHRHGEPLAEAAGSAAWGQGSGATGPRRPSWGPRWEPGAPERGPRGETL